MKLTCSTRILGSLTQNLRRLTDAWYGVQTGQATKNTDFIVRNHCPAFQPKLLKRDFIFLKTGCKSVLLALGGFDGIFANSNDFGGRISTF